MPARIHPTALIEEGVSIGDGTSIWDSVHVRGPQTVIGRDCIVGEKTYIAYDVHIGDRVKVNAFVYICAGVTIEDGVMVSAGTIFTNDRYPRAVTPDLAELLPSDPPPDLPRTTVRAGATIGAGAIIGPGLEIGRFAVVGMGAVATRSVGDHHLVIGNPARVAGLVCACGHPWRRELPDGDEKGPCQNCGLEVVWQDGRCRMST
jgi:acetyltransferase-like isoleucine patch superfamily enzyme